MSAEIETAGQFGGPDASRAILPLFHGPMKQAAINKQLFSLDERVRQLSLLLRVSGKFQQFEGDPVENVKFARSREWISVDVLLLTDDWQNKNIVEIADTFCRRVRTVAAVLKPICTKKHVAIDSVLLDRELHDYADDVMRLASYGG